MGVEEADEKKKAFYQSEHYFDLTGAAVDVQIADGAKETATALGKLAGKSVFNAGLFAGKAGFFLGKEALKNAPDLVARMAERNLRQNGHLMSDEQVQKTAEYVEKNKGRTLFGQKPEGE